MFWYVLAGVAGGVIGGMGMGGGTLLIPILTLMLSVPQMEAQAINLIVFIPMALATLIIHVKNKLVDFKKLIFSLPLAVIMAVVGAFVVKSLGDDILRKAFGAFMLAVGIAFFIKAVIKGVVSKLSDHKAF